LTAQRPRPEGQARETDHEPNTLVSTTLFLCGDVMLGRGIDQILAHPSAPALDEPFVADARDYVRLAESANGPIPRGADDAYVWGVALEELARRRPDARLVNLETSITRSDAAEPKGINYRMHPANAGALSAAGIDCAVLANNHVLDWGRAGLDETLAELAARGIRTAGAGATADAAESPALLTLRDGTRLLVVGVGGPDCGIPASWRATDDESGVFRLDDYSTSSVDRVVRAIARERREGDLVVVSIHWGGNWGDDVPDAHRRFARALIDRAGVALVHGHSSHHPRGIELYRASPILYGCGDFLNDYEGIGDREGYRSDLAFMYFATVGAGRDRPPRLELVPLQLRRFRLERPSTPDREWLLATMARACRRLGTKVDTANGVLVPT